MFYTPNGYNTVKDIKTLSEILGHSSVKFTLERYVHPSDEHKKMNLEKLEIFY